MPASDHPADRVRIEIERDGEIHAWELKAEPGHKLRLAIHAGVNEPDQDITEFTATPRAIAELRALELKLDASGWAAQLIREASKPADGERRG